MPKNIESISQIGILGGGGVMGANIARNFANHEVKTVIYDLNKDKTDEIIQKYGSDFLSGCENIKDFIDKLEKPRKIIIMVPAGANTDTAINALLPFLDPKDIIIDAGNSNYQETIRRQKEISQTGISFIGMGVSGGAKGALEGPSIMPSGDLNDYKQIEPLLKKIAAKDFLDEPCVAYLGTDGAGHFVKMVHNGIEYANMALIAETYDILSKNYGLSVSEISQVFKNFNQNELAKTYLLDIVSTVLQKKDENQKPLVESILDKAGQKGTGSLTIIDAQKRGVSIPSIESAVFSRNISNDKDIRLILSERYKNSLEPQEYNSEIESKLKNAFLSAVVLSYTQGFSLIKQASDEQDWNIDMSEVSRIWQGGCIIRSEFLSILTNIFKNNPNIENLLESDLIEKLIKDNIASLRTVSRQSIDSGIPTPTYLSSLEYFDSITSQLLPANLVQGLRDCFGAHTYQRIDQEGTFHTDWEKITPIIAKDMEGLSNLAYEKIIASAAKAKTENRNFYIALSGGSTPKRLYEMLAENKDKIDFNHWHIFLADERCISETSKDNTYAWINDVLLSKIPINQGQIHKVNTSLESPEAMAINYQKEIEKTFNLEANDIPEFDIIIAGVGQNDGHTASLFPDQPALSVNDKSVTYSKPGINPPQIDRVTLTYPVLNKAKEIIFLASGENKRSVFESQTGPAFKVKNPNSSYIISY